MRARFEGSQHEERCELTPPLCHGHFFSCRQLSQFHAENSSELFLCSLEDGLELSRPLLTEHFGTDVAASNREAGVLAGKREAHQLFDHGISAGWCVWATIAIGHVGLGGF